MKRARLDVDLDLAACTWLPGPYPGFLCGGVVLSKKWTFFYFSFCRQGGGGAGACSPDFAFNPSCAVKTVYIYVFKQISDYI